MNRVLLPLWFTMVVVCAGPPQGKAAAPPAPSTAPAQQQQSQQEDLQQAAAARVGKMKNSLDRQRASVLKQVSDYITLGEPRPNDTFFLPWPKTSISATSIALTSIEPVVCDPIPEPELDRIVLDASSRQKISPKVVRAIIAQESGGRPCAVSTAGAQGLMQLMPEVQRELAVDDPFDARQSVEAGVKLLRKLMDRYAGDLPKALAAYNAGPGSVDKAGGIPPIPETIHYVAEIVKRIE